MRTIKRTIVGAFVFASDDKILLGMMAPKGGSTYASQWVIPGGGVEQRETALDALCREFREETGLDLSPYEARQTDLTGTTDIREKTLPGTGERVLVDMRFINYEVHIAKSADQLPLTPNDEFGRLEGVSIAELPNLSLAKSVKDFLKQRGQWPASSVKPEVPA